MPLLSVQDLHVRIGSAHILRGVSFDVAPGETLGVVGESGCGKSMTGLAVMGMLPPAAVTEGSMDFEDLGDLTQIGKKEWLDIRGQDISMVMQDPFTSLNPMMRVGDQIAEVYRLHQGTPKQEARAKALEMIKKVGVPNPEVSALKYPHQMSGGQRQRIVIAIAFASRPKLLIADEPTTALDVTLQAQILRLLNRLQEEEGTSVILISHDIGVIAAMSHRIAVYYAGKVVEIGTAEEVLKTPQHPYTKALLDSLPAKEHKRLNVIEGQPPALTETITECAFADRCPERFEKCDVGPDLIELSEGRASACWHVEQAAKTSS
jgi:oligopeptide/dipeptide ABC transporter ATP-binding protein